jgi:preprotein translocase subunit SecA
LGPRRVEVNLEVNAIDPDNAIATERSIRDDGKQEIESQIRMTVGEYMDPDVEPQQWDISGLAQWASSRFGSKLSQNQLRKMPMEEIVEHLIESAHKKIDEADLSPVERILDPDFGKSSFLQWARQKFGIELPAESFTELSDDKIVARLRESVREAYREREVRYPVEWILERTVLGDSIDNAYAADNLAQWVNLKFNLGWTVDQVRGRTVKELADELIRLNRDYSQNGRLQAEIDQAQSENGDLAEWGKRRFGPAFDPSTFDAAQDRREALLTFGRDLLRRELTALERYVLLQIYDQAWKDHMHAIDLLKESIGLRGFAEQDPKIAYKREGFQMFQEMLDGIHDKVTSIIFKARLADESVLQSRYQIGAVRHADATNLGFTGGGSADQDRAAAMQAQGEQKVETIRREEPKVGRNEPCPCGSGKKYKQCHGKGK